MKKTASVVIVVLLLSSFLEIGFVIRPVRASENVDTLKMTTLEDVSVLENGTVQVSILMNVSSGPLADMYRKMLAAPATAGIEEEVPIPENTTEEIDAGGKATDASIPVREGFYESIVKEQLLSLGLRTGIIEARMVPRGNENECRVIVSALGSFEIFNVTSTDSTETWEVGMGPFNTTGITGLVLTRLMFTQMMLGSLPGEQVYQNFWHTRLRLPTNAVLLNKDSLSGLSWKIDFSERTHLDASVSLDETAAINLDENIVIAEDSVAAAPEISSNVLSTYKAFEIRYSLPDHEPKQLESKDEGHVNTNYSFHSESKVILQDIPLPFKFTHGEDYLDLKLTVSPQFNITEDVGWQFYNDWNFPFLHLDKFWAQIGLETSIGIKLEANASVVLYHPLQRTLFQTKMTYFFYYGVPGWVDLVFTINADLVIEGHMSFVAKTVVTGELVARVQWNHTNGWDKIFRSETTNVTDFTWGLAVGVSVTPSIRFRAELLFYGVAGPYVEFVPYVDITADMAIPNATISVDITVALNISVGVTFRGWLGAVLGRPDYSWPLFHIVLWQWTGTWPLTSQGGRELIHDLGIVSLTTSPPGEIFANSLVGVNVTVRDSGDYNESSEVMLFQNDSLIRDWGVVNFSSGNDNCLSVGWDTSGKSPGESYVLKVTVSPVEDEVSTANNEMNITVLIVGRNDIAIVSLEKDLNETFIGRPVNITVAIKNLGELTEDSNVTINANTTAIETSPIDQLTPGQSITMTFIWSTGGLNAGQYVIWANLSTLHYDIDITNNNLTSAENVVRLRMPLHDVAVTDVAPYRNWVYEGRLVPVNVTLLNCGDFNETVTLDLYYNLTANQQIGTIITNLSPNETKTLTFVWNTLGVQHCHNYTITACANIQFDSNTTDNFKEGNVRIKVRILGDINGDGSVNMADISIVINAFLTLPRHPLWNPSADINNDNSVDMLDVSIAIVHFMQP